MLTIKPWIISSDRELEAGPCGHGCSAMSMHSEHEVCGRTMTLWDCPHGKWRPLDFLDVTLPHDGDFCPGNCQFHPLMNGPVLEMARAMLLGVSWGDLMQEELDARRAAETPEERAARLAQEAAERVRFAKSLVDFNTKRKAAKWCKDGARKFRVARPCKYAQLFLENKCAKCNGPCPDEVCPNAACKEVKASCWAHDVFMCCRGCPPPADSPEGDEVDMRDGCPRCGGATDSCCIYVHPDEPQWADAVAGRLLFDRDAQSFYLRGQPKPAPVNRFVAAAREQGVRVELQAHREAPRQAPQQRAAPPAAAPALNRKQRRALEQAQKAGGGGGGCSSAKTGFAALADSDSD